MTKRMAVSLREEIDLHGFAVVNQLVDDIELDALRMAIDQQLPITGAHRRRGSGPTFAIRNAVGVIPAAAALAGHAAIKSLVECILGPAAFVARSIIFDKIPDANWSVPWHQDTTIAVRDRIDTPGFGPWSVKAGIPHVQPPRAVLEKMLTLRLHLDDCDGCNGALHVLPGSHAAGVLDAAAIAGWKSRAAPECCEVRAGGAMLMRPLILHASSRATVPRHRRVLHLEFASTTLPGRLSWCETA